MTLAQEATKVMKQAELEIIRLRSINADLLAVCKAAKEHTAELREAWQRGSITEFDGKGGTRSNRNADVDIKLGAAIKAAEEK